MSNRSVFVDTSFYYASLDPRDAHHEKAIQLNHQVVEKKLQMLSTWEIICETVTLLRNRFGYKAAVLFIDQILPSLEIIYIDDDIRALALKWFKKLSADKKISLCDVVSYLLVTQKLDHIPILAFDDDFKDLGLTFL